MSNNEIRLPEGLDVETATDVLREFARTDEAQIVSGDELDALKAEITEAKEAFAAVLAEESPQSADTLARQDMDALTEPFRDDDGAIDVDTLRQDPQTGDPDGATDGGDGGGFDPEAITLSQKQELETLSRKRTVMANRGMDKRASEIAQEMVDLVGADDYDTLEAEVL
jgi:hypothetical protein